MKSLHLVSGVVFALMVAACAADQSTDVADPASTTDTSQVITIPRELSPLPPTDGTIEGNAFTGAPDITPAVACHVTLLFCHDPRLSPRIPSFCQNGGCTTARAVSAAFSLCDQICGRSACNVIAQFPNSPSC